jgi:hypothetical protein
VTHVESRLLIDVIIDEDLKEGKGKGISIPSWCLYAMYWLPLLRPRPILPEAEYADHRTTTSARGYTAVQACPTRQMGD